MRRSLKISFLGSLLFVPVLAADLLSEGKQAMEAGDFHKAERIFAAVRDDDRRCEAIYYLGIARYRLGKLEPAIIDLRSASQCNPSNAGAQLALAQVYLEKKNEDLAGAALEAALKIKPDDPVALRVAASMYMRRDLHAQAIEKLEALVRVSPNDFTAHADLGVSYASLGDIEKGRAELQKALKLRPDDASSLVGLGNVYLKTGQTDQAVDLLQRAAKKDPKACEPRYLLGTIAASGGHHQEALENYQESIRLGCKDPEIHYRLAYAYRGLGRNEESKQEMAKFTQMRTQSNASVEATRESLRLLERAKQLVDEGKLMEALSLTEKASDLDPTNPRLHFRVASLHFDLKNLVPARGHVEQAIFLAPSEWMYHYLLALIEESEGKTKAQKESLDAVVRLNPSFADAFNRLGNLAVSNRDYLEAIRNYRKAIQLEPGEKAYQLNLATAQSKAGK